MLVLLGIIVYFVTAGVVGSAEHDTDILLRIKALENKVERQNNFRELQDVTIKDLRETLASQQQNIAELKDTLELQQKDITELKETVTSQQQNIAELKDIVASQHQDIVDLEASVTARQNEENAIRRYVPEEVNNAKKRFVLDTLETVAFEATISGGKYVEHTHIHDKIVFETVSLNVGNGYQSGNGTFVAPMGGIYIFSTSVMMHGANTQDLNMHIILEKNGVEIAGAFAYNSGPYEHSSVTAAMDLQAGDSVYVSVERHDDITFYGDNLTSFMGFLLFPF